MSVTAEIVAHHLRLFGFSNAGTDDVSEIFVVDQLDGSAIGNLRRAASAGQTVVALAPDPEFLSGSASNPHS